MYYRSDIFKYGIENVWAHPIFGIGLNDWQRPDWMADPTVDNFWLLVAMRHGILGFLFLALATVILLVGKTTVASQSTTALRTGVGISLLATVFAGTTVHFWGALLTHFAFLLGLTSAIKTLPNSEMQMGKRRPV